MTQVQSHLISPEDNEKPSIEQISDNSLPIKGLTNTPQYVISLSDFEEKEQHLEENSSIISTEQKRGKSPKVLEELTDFFRLFVSQKSKSFKEARREDGLNTLKLSPLHLYISRQNRNGGDGSI